MFLIYYSFIITSVVSVKIFDGMDDLDQEVEAAISPGGDVVLGDFPFAAAVFNSLQKQQTCTGIIVRQRIVLSTGYCVTDITNDVVDPEYVSVLSGVVDMRDRDGDQWRVAEKIISSDFEQHGFSILVLIKVNFPFFLNFTTRPVNYTLKRHPRNGMCTSLTWRFYDKLGRLTLKSLVMKKYAMMVMNQTTCEATYGKNPIMLGMEGTNFVCAKVVEQMSQQDLRARCVGVDGSTLICEENQKLVPVGIAAEYLGGSTCNRQREEILTFFDVGAYGSWIDREVEKLK